jgi:hypothetical protein
MNFFINRLKISTNVSNPNSPSPQKLETEEVLVRRSSGIIEHNIKILHI